MMLLQLASLFILGTANQQNVKPVLVVSKNSLPESKISELIENQSKLETVGILYKFKDYDLLVRDDLTNHKYLAALKELNEQICSEGVVNIKDCNIVIGAVNAALVENGYSQFSSPNNVVIESDPVLKISDGEKTSYYVPNSSGATPALEKAKLRPSSSLETNIEPIHYSARQFTTELSFQWVPRVKPIRIDSETTKLAIGDYFELHKTSIQEVLNISSKLFQKAVPSTPNFTDVKDSKVFSSLSSEEQRELSQEYRQRYRELGFKSESEANLFLLRAKVSQQSKRLFLKVRIDENSYLHFQIGSN